MGAHARLAPSSAHRWLRCPASVAGPLIDSESSDAADEGSWLHELAAAMLESGDDAEGDIGLRSSCGRFEVTPDDAEGLQLYLDTVRAHQGIFGGHLAVESSAVAVSCDAPDLVCRGTGDAVLVRERTGVVEVDVFDLKMGRGVFVDAVENEQLGIYALAAVAALGHSPHARNVTVRLHVVQPRYPSSKPHRWWTCAPGWLADLRKRVKNVQQLFADLTHETVWDTSRTAGAHCQWCPKLADCPAAREASLAAAQGAFEVVPEGATDVVQQLTPERIAELLKLIPQAEDYFKAVRARARDLALSGTPVPGWKLTRSLGHRRWLDDAPEGPSVADALLALGIDPLTDPVTVPPAEAERRLKAAGLKKKEAAAALAPLVTRPWGAPALVPSDSPGEPYDPAAAFDSVTK